MLKQFLVSTVLFLGIAGIAQAEEQKISPWSMEADLGNAFYDGVSKSDSSTPIGRFSIGRDVFFIPNAVVGFEIGIQSGNTMRLNIPQESIDALGGVPIEVEAKPMLDTLVKFQSKKLQKIPINLWVKGGIAYHSMHIDRESIKVSSDYSTEFQGGLGYQMDESATLMLGYQMIFGQKYKLIINPENENGYFSPLLLEQQSILIGIFYHI